MRTRRNRRDRGVAGLDPEAVYRMEPESRDEQVVYNRSCRTKIAHRTRQDARVFVRATRVTNKAEGSGDVEAYRCVFCGHWHVGHTVSPRSMMWSTHESLWRRRNRLTGEAIPALYIERRWYSATPPTR